MNAHPLARSPSPQHHPWEDSDALLDPYEPASDDGDDPDLEAILPGYGNGRRFPDEGEE